MNGCDILHFFALWCIIIINDNLGVVNINKGSSEYNSWLDKRNIKNLKRRSKKKIKRKKIKESLIKYNIKIKKTGFYDKKTNQFYFVAPLNFSFISNVEETSVFFKNLNNFVIDKRNNGKNIFVDTSQITKLTIDALIYLLAVMYVFNTEASNKHRISGNEPKNSAVKKTFYDSGFYQYVACVGGRQFTGTNSNRMRIISGRNVKTNYARQISDFILEKTNLKKTDISFLYIMMIELMSNTYKHAYNISKQSSPAQWYCFVEYNNYDTFSFTFVDTGFGIPATVRKNFLEKIDFLKLKTEDKYVISALNGDFRTSTNKKNRGKGLPKIRNFCSSGKILNMRIITNSADVLVERETCLSSILKTPLQGTLYYWQINTLNL